MSAPVAVLRLVGRRSSAPGVPQARDSQGPAEAEPGSSPGGFLTADFSAPAAVATVRGSGRSRPAGQPRLRESGRASAAARPAREAAVRCRRGRGPTGLRGAGRVLPVLRLRLQEGEQVVSAASQPVGRLEELARPVVAVEVEQHAHEEQPIGIANVLADPAGHALDQAQDGEPIVVAEDCLQPFAVRGPGWIEVEPLFDVLDGRVEAADRRQGVAQAEIGSGRSLAALTAAL